MISRAPVAVALMSALFASPVGADERTAEQHYADGMRHYKAGSFLKAARSYVFAYDDAKAPELAYNAARAFDKGRRWKDARRYYDRWLDGAPPLAERERLSERLVRSSDKAARRNELDLALGRLQLARELLVTPDPDLTYRLARVFERADRRKEASATYTQAQEEGYGDPAAIEEALRRLDGGPSSGRVVLVGDAQDIRVRIDGKPMPEVQTGAEFELPPGKHKVLIDRDGHRSWRGIVEVRPGRLTSVPIQLAPVARTGRPSAPPPAPQPSAAPPRPGGAAASLGPFAWPPPGTVWLAFGVGAAAAVSGAFFGSLAAGAEEDLDVCVNKDDRNCATSKVATELSVRADSWQTRANVAYVGAALGVAAGATLWYLRKAGGEREQDDLEELEDDLTAFLGLGVAGVRWSF